MTERITQLTINWEWLILQNDKQQCKGGARTTALENITPDRCGWGLVTETETEDYEQ